MIKVHLLERFSFENLGVIKKALTIINALIKYDESNKGLRQASVSKVNQFYYLLTSVFLGPIAAPPLEL